MLHVSGHQPADHSIYIKRSPGLQSRQAWPAREEAAQPGMRPNNLHTQFFYTSLPSVALTRSQNYGFREEGRKKGKKGITWIKEALKQTRKT